MLIRWRSSKPKCKAGIGAVQVVPELAGEDGARRVGRCLAAIQEVVLRRQRRDELLLSKVFERWQAQERVARDTLEALVAW